MRIIPHSQSACERDDVVFRASRLWGACGAVVCLIFPAVGLVVWQQGQHVLGGWFLGFGMFVFLLVARQFFKLCRADNWLLRFNRRRLLIKLGSVFGGDQAKLMVLELAPAEIEWLRAHQIVTVAKSSDSFQNNHSARLELKLREGELSALATQLALAGQPARWHGWTISNPLPVGLTGEGLLYLEWRGRNLLIAPSLKRAQTLLAQTAQIPVQPAIHETNDLSLSSADKEKLDAQILTLVENGETIEAIKLTRQRYGYPLAEAKRFVESLQPPRAGKKEF